MKMCLPRCMSPDLRLQAKFLAFSRDIVDVGKWALFPEFHRACLVSAPVMCGTWITVLSRRWLSKTSPQGHRMRGARPGVESTYRLGRRLGT
jgi:hypothetical protein